MPRFEVWNVIKVPFPSTARPIRQRRPALVVAVNAIQEEHGLLWILMITSAENKGWSGDVPVSDLDTAGLPAPSLIRTAKIATIEAKDAEFIGTLTANDRTLVLQQILTTLNFQ